MPSSAINQASELFVSDNLKAAKEILLLLGILQDKITTPRAAVYVIDDYMMRLNASYGHLESSKKLLAPIRAFAAEARRVCQASMG
jgi:hypothetical protein